MYDIIIRKRVEKLYVECGLDVNTIYKRCSDQVKRSAMYSWCKKDDWAGKRKQYFQKPKSQEERLSEQIDRTLVELEIANEPAMVAALTKYAVALKTIYSVDINNIEKEKTNKPDQPVN